MKRLALFAILAGLVAASHDAVRKQFDRLGSVMWETDILTTADFERQELEHRFDKFVAKRDPSIRIINVTLADATSSSILSQVGYREVTYELWRPLYDEYIKTDHPFGELVVLGDNAAMRVRDNRGQQSLKVLHGKNPYVLTACGEQLSLVNLAVSKSLRANGQNQWYASVHLFLTTNGPVDERTAECALEEFHRLTSVGDILISLRRDPWFIRYSDFPIAPPFLTTVKPPTSEQFKEAPWSECFLSEEKTHCQHWKGQPSQTDNPPKQ